MYGFDSVVEYLCNITKIVMRFLDTRCFVSSDDGAELPFQTLNPLLKASFFSLMAQTQNVAFNSARNGGGGGNSFWADAQRDKSFCDVEIKILEHHQTDNRFTSDLFLEMHS